MIDSPNEIAASSTEAVAFASLSCIDEQPPVPQWLKHALALRFIFLGVQAAVLLILFVGWFVRDLGLR